MSTILNILRALADPTRLRLLALLEKEELSVNELQEITHLGQSRISTHLGQLQKVGLVQSRREGKRAFYRMNRLGEQTFIAAVELAVRGAGELPERMADLGSLKRVLTLRDDLAQNYFNQIAGRFDRSYGPGRSWQAFSQLLLRMMPALVIADLGSGEGLVSELLARRARHIIAVDNSEKMVQFGSEKALANGLTNLEFRVGDLQNPPIDPHSVDLAILSQALHHAENPAEAIRAAAKILKVGGQILILDLRAHSFEQARELYGDLWLGFRDGEIHQWLEESGFKNIEVTRVAREEQPPHFETLLATATLERSPVVETHKAA